MRRSRGRARRSARRGRRGRTGSRNGGHRTPGRRTPAFRVSPGGELGAQPGPIPRPRRAAGGRGARRIRALQPARRTRAGAAPPRSSWSPIASRRRGDPLVEFARLARRCAGRGGQRGRTSPIDRLYRRLVVDYREDDGAAARLLAWSRWSSIIPSASPGDVLGAPPGRAAAAAAGAGRPRWSATGVPACTRSAGRRTTARRLAAAGSARLER